MFQCADGPPGDPTLCGSAAAGTGYGCYLKTMIQTWRDAWSTAPLASTSPLFPIGVVSLAGGTSEGHPDAMPSFRNAQTGGGGLLPSKELPATFVAQAYDAAEPAGGDEGDGNSCQLNDQTDEGGYPCAAGFARFTPFFMGGIRTYTSDLDPPQLDMSRVVYERERLLVMTDPRAKRVVGQRLAAAARALVYKDTQTPWTGPVFTGCKLTPDPNPSAKPDPKHNLCDGLACGPRLQLTFDASTLGIARDSLAVRQPGWELAIHGPPNPHQPYPESIGARGQPFHDLAEAGLLTVELLTVLTKAWRPGAPGGSHHLLYTSPLEVRYGGSRTNLSDGGVWLSARLMPVCFMKPGKLDPKCGWNTTTGDRQPDWNVASAALPLERMNTTDITALRYAWAEDPCCPGADRTVTPCPPNSCPLQGHASGLPAVPFLARIGMDGSCDWNSISDPPLL